MIRPQGGAMEMMPQRHYAAAVALRRLGTGELMFWHRCLDYTRFDGAVLKRNLDAYVQTFPEAAPGPDEAACPECEAIFLLS